MKKEKSLMLDLRDDLGKIELVREIASGVYYVVAADGETALPSEYYIAEKNCSALSDEAKAYGRVLEHRHNYLCFRVDVPEEGRVVLEYEVNRCLARQKQPLLEGDSLLTIVSYGREYNPEYFGDYPAPCITPRGLTLRYVMLSSGIFAIETDRLEKVLAVCHPIWDCDLSCYAKEKAELLDYGGLNDIRKDEGYLFFPESSACIALFELWKDHSPIAQSGKIDFTAMMNAIWAYHPEYAASHNLREQTGQNDGFGSFLRSLGCDVELKGNPKNLIALSEGTGIDYLLL